MEVKLKLNKDVNYNAEVYFSKAKKLKSKLPGIEKIIQRTRGEILELEKKKEFYIEKKVKKQKIEQLRRKEWFEKFRWTILSSNHLFVIGKDAGSNEILIKKYAEDLDLIMHSEAPGSPFGIIKNAFDNDGNLLLKKTEVEEAGEFLLAFSSQWKKGFGTADIFWVRKEQVTKKTNSGEYMSKGSFMIYGNKNIIKNLPLRICIGVRKIKLEDGEEVLYIEEPFSGSLSACKKFCKDKLVKLEPGQLKYKALSKMLSKLLKLHIDDLPKYIPNDCKILKK